MIRVSVNCSAEYVINLLINVRVRLLRVKKTQNGCEVHIRSGDLEVLRNTLTGSGREFQIISDSTWRTFFKRNIVRLGLIIGLVLAIAGLAIYSMNVTRIVISGNSRVDTDLIRETVVVSASLPSKRSDIDRGEIIKRVTLIDGISNASVEIRGNTVIVNVYEDLERVEIFDQTDYRKIVSEYDAEITRIIAFTGTAVVKKGDTVKKGEVLIDSFVQLDEELSVQERASGQVYGQVWLSKRLFFPPTVTVISRTGKSVSRLFRAGSKAEFDCGYAIWERETEEVVVNAVIPLRLIKVTYFEMEERQREWDFDNNADAIIADSFRKMEEELPEGSIKLNTRYEIKRVDKNVYLDIYYLVELEISIKGG